MEKLLGIKLACYQTFLKYRAYERYPIEFGVISDLNWNDSDWINQAFLSDLADAIAKYKDNNPEVVPLKNLGFSVHNLNKGDYVETRFSRIDVTDTRTKEYIGSLLYDRKEHQMVNDTRFYPKKECYRKDEDLPTMFQEHTIYYTACLCMGDLEFYQWLKNTGKEDEILYG